MPFPDNAPNIDDLINLPAGELAQLPVDLLAGLQGELDHAARQLKVATTRFNTALEVRYATRAAEARRDAGKDTGTVRLVDGTFTIIADLPKRVEWDQERLAQIAASIAASGEDPAEFIETTLKVSERKYAALPEAWRKGFEPARTVKTGALKIAIVPQGSDQ
ncbi:MAG: hypothetical protein JJU40_03830 [Rhodobacteraceae bacterium]|nr:hypothetical protein [Paracoccaceae bacterium]